MPLCLAQRTTSRFSHGSQADILEACHTASSVYKFRINEQALDMTATNDSNFFLVSQDIDVCEHEMVT